jgi:hypothetical protein
MTTGAQVTLGTGVIDKVFENLILESNFGLGQSVGGCFHSLIDLTYDMHWPASALVVPCLVAMALVPWPVDGE